MKAINKNSFNFVISRFFLVSFLLISNVPSYCQDTRNLEFINCENFEDSCILIGNKFIDNLSEKQFNNLAHLFSENILFRALIPSSLRTSNNPNQTASTIKNWFYVDDSEKYEILDSKVEVLVDCLHIYYKIFETYKGSPYNVEQHLYCEVTDGKIDKLSLICSGFKKLN